MPSLRRDASGQILRESRAMRLLRKVGRDDLAWSLRRLHVPVTSEALVLEVGSGGNPFPRANVLLDAYEASRERHYQPLVADRPTVLGQIENLPFRDDAFAFVIACHVIEHSLDIEACQPELPRVARAGYIETPDAFFERINPYHDHRLELTDREGVIEIQPKRAWLHAPELVSLFEAKLKGSPGWRGQIRENPFPFHMRYFWSREDGGIRYRLAHAQDPSAVPSAGEEKDNGETAQARTLRQVAIRGARELLAQKARNRSLDVLSLLRCPACHTNDLAESDASLKCGGCGARYDHPTRSFARMLPAKAAATP